MNTRCIDDRCIKGFVPNIKEEPDLPDSSFVVLGISVLEDSLEFVDDVFYTIVSSFF